MTDKLLCYFTAIKIYQFQPMDLWEKKYFEGVVVVYSTSIKSNNLKIG